MWRDRYRIPGVQEKSNRQEFFCSAALGDTVEDLRQQLEFYKLIFDSIHHGSTVTDADGYITHFNKPYGEFLGLDPEAQIGRHCTEVLENTRMHLVAQLGQPEICQPQRINGKDMVVQRIPMRKDGKVIAVFGQVMFKNVEDLQRIAERLSLLESKVEFYAKELLSLRSARYTFDSIFSKSERMHTLKNEALKAAGNNLPVLITGESGTGKEVFAQAIHQASRRRKHPFVRINCAAIPRDLLESELFGYEKGAFTGASAAGKPGKFELAHRGTIFLDEIGDLPLDMQPKLLRVLEEREFERVGGTALRRADFRLIAATNQNLDKMRESGGFRNDLFYRLSVIQLHMPPLRERQEEIGDLTRHLLARILDPASFAEIRLEPDAEEALVSHSWPGNVRELANVLERALSTMEGNAIRLCDLPAPLRTVACTGVHSGAASTGRASSASLKKVKHDAEKDAILAAMAQCGGNISKTAVQLGIHRTLLYKKMKKYGVSPKDLTKTE